MPVQGANATKSVKSYVQSIIDFKDAVRAGTVNSAQQTARVGELRVYYKEASGRRKGFRTGGAIDYVSRHGEVVEELSNWRVAKGLVKGESLKKNVWIDLGVAVGGKLTELYEVKTSAVRGDVYTAIGQLAVHAPDQLCRRIMVLPDQVLQPSLATALKRNGIELMRYRLTARSVKLL